MGHDRLQRRSRPFRLLAPRGIPLCPRCDALITQAGSKGRGMGSRARLMTARIGRAALSLRSRATALRCISAPVADTGPVTATRAMWGTGHVTPKSPWRNPNHGRLVRETLGLL